MCVGSVDCATSFIPFRRPPKHHLRQEFELFVLDDYFMQLDVDHNGKVTRAELKEVMDDMGFVEEEDVSYYSTFFQEINKPAQVWHRSWLKAFPTRRLAESVAVDRKHPGAVLRSSVTH